MDLQNKTVAALVAAAVLASWPVRAQVPYRTYVVRPAINNDAILEDEPLPAVCRDEAVMTIMAARGEYEPASFLVKTDQPLEQVMVRVEPLKGAAGVLPPEAVDVRIARKFYRAITWQCVAMPWVLVHDPGMLKIVDKHQKWVTEIAVEKWDSPGGHSLEEYQAGRSRMNQLTRELIDTEELQPGDVQDFRQFWLTVHIPDDAPSGTYRAPVTISAKNAPATKLTLEVTVPDFDLLPPKFEYSTYYAATLSDEMSERQYLAECRNMVAHGCTNPSIWDGPGLDEDGNLNLTKLSRYLDLREQAGMAPGGPLYMFDGGGMIIKSGELTEAQKQHNVEVARQVVAWARTRGYSDVFFMGIDEASGERLRSGRESYESIRQGGAKIWVAIEADFLDIAGDLIDRPILTHPGHRLVDAHQQWLVDSTDYLLHRQQMVTYDPELLMTPNIQKMIKGVHKNGFKMFTQMDPVPGDPQPDLHRRSRGLGMWKTGFDGTMTRAYINHHGPSMVRFDNQKVKDNGVGIGPFNFVLRGPGGVLDTLSWEGYREGRDDARYLATLQDAIARAKAAGRHARLVARTERWLGDITVNADLDAWRLEMARRTGTLLKP